MSNKTQLQTNNNKYASLIEVLRGKAVSSGGEDVAEETTAYTAKLETLETAITALETELEGKASGGGGGVVSVTVYNNSPNPVYYFDENGAQCEIAHSSSQTVNALNGIVFYSQVLGTECQGLPNTYFHGIIYNIYIAIFLADGGSMICHSD